MACHRGEFVAKQHEIAVFTPPEFDVVRSAIFKAIQNVGAIPSSPEEISNQVTLQGLIKGSTAIVAYITGSDSDVMYPIGLAQALSKPIITVANSFTDIPRSLEAIECIILSNFDTIDSFMDKISHIVGNVIKHPNRYSYEAALEEKNKKQTIFISYSHNDKEHLERLLIHLAPLKKQGMLDLWVDTHLRAGDKWKLEIQKALDRATVAVLIVSADFLASDFVVENELPPLLRGAEEKGVRIIPFIAKPCRFTRDGNLKHFQSINDPKEALVLLDVGQREKIFDAVCAEVERYLKK